MQRVAFWQHHFHYQQTAIRFDCLADMAKDRETLILVPVMDDVRKDVSIPTRGYGLKKSPASIVTRCPTPFSTSNEGASGTTWGRSNNTPLGPAWRERMATSMFPVAPPTSTMVLKVEKS